MKTFIEYILENTLKNKKVGDSVKLYYSEFNKVSPRGEHIVTHVSPDAIHVQNKYTKEVEQYHPDTGKGIGHSSAKYDFIK